MSFLYLPQWRRFAAAAAVSAAVSAAAPAAACVPSIPMSALRSRSGHTQAHSFNSRRERRNCGLRPADTAHSTRLPSAAALACSDISVTSQNFTTAAAAGECWVELANSMAAAWPLSLSLSHYLSLTTKMAAAAWRCHDNALRSLCTCLRRRSQRRLACSHIWFAEGSRFHAIGFRRRHFETERRKEIGKYFNAKFNN